MNIDKTILTYDSIKVTQNVYDNGVTITIVGHAQKITYEKFLDVREDNHSTWVEIPHPIH